MKKNLKEKRKKPANDDGIASMIRLKNREEIKRIKESGTILSDLYKEIRKLITSGITTGELDKFAKDFVEKRGAKPAFLGYMNYPASICISVNDEVIHGIPGKRKLKDGDIVSLDFGVDLKGFISDAAITLPVGRISKQNERLLKVTEECLSFGLEQAVFGNRVKDISRSIFDHAVSNGYGIVREFCGHGVGFQVHEAPQVPNYVFSGTNPRLKEGLVLAIEPMVNIGTGDVEILDDNWTVVTADNSNSAHFEHTVAIFEDHTEILTAGE